MTCAGSSRSYFPRRCPCGSPRMCAGSSRSHSPRRCPCGSPRTCAGSSRPHLRDDVRADLLGCVLVVRDPTLRDDARADLLRRVLVVAMPLSVCVVCRISAGYLHDGVETTRGIPPGVLPGFPFLVEPWRRPSVAAASGPCHRPFVRLRSPIPPSWHAAQGDRPGRERLQAARGQRRQRPSWPKARGAHLTSCELCPGGNCHPRRCGR